MKPGLCESGYQVLKLVGAKA